MANGGIPAAMVIAWWAHRLGNSLHRISVRRFIAAAEVGDRDWDTFAEETKNHHDIRNHTCWEFGCCHVYWFLGAIGGSLSIIAFASLWLSNNNFGQIVLITVTAGLAGAIVDSLQVQQSESIQMREMWQDDGTFVLL